MVKANGIDEITLLPRFERMHSATPNVRMNREIKSRQCCQRKGTILSLSAITNVWFIIGCKVTKIIAKFAADVRGVRRPGHNVEIYE